MTREDLRILLSNQSDVDFVEREIFGRCPWIFEDEKLYEPWRRFVASQLGLVCRFRLDCWQRSYRLQPEPTQAWAAVPGTSQRHRGNV